MRKEHSIAQRFIVFLTTALASTYVTVGGPSPTRKGAAKAWKGGREYSVSNAPVSKGTNKGKNRPSQTQKRAGERRKRRQKGRLDIFSYLVREIA
mmetsp:Transcript_37045/g.96037  ORF Transcript_37045/g.96037 Transcript_37045/m.96037 type:complete len:95 (+) Transcript_37045:355-639(+)